MHQQHGWVAGVAKDVQNIRLLEIDMRFFPTMLLVLKRYLLTLLERASDNN